MKTYEEMAQAVIHRAKAHRAARNRRIISVAAAVLCVCGISLAAAKVNQPDTMGPSTLQVEQMDPTNGTGTGETEITTAPSVPDQTVAPSTARVTFLSAAANGSDAVDMRKDVKTPYRMQIRLKDITGLTKEDAQALREAEQKYANDLIAQYPKTDGWQWNQGGGDGTIITVVSAGHFILRIEDPEQVESIHVSLAGDGQLFNIPAAPDWEDHMPYEYSLSDEEIERYYYIPHGGIQMGWTLDTRLYYQITPDTPLSSFSDTITVTVAFKDGVVETHAIDIIIDDSGEIYTVYRGETAAM